ncbi:MAG: glycoside hydrolase family 3 C-terminal domain-containing protein [Alistipes sp.]|nr:glycoside hydrolase family 3 C-terminal domain-containing protein [Alistipes senegalensis]MCM1250990.1 glycoside hydrolase family 3 C-terminal domain-containing protein [Alistipes sp.]
MKRILMLLTAVSVLGPARAQTPRYLDLKAPVEERVEDALARMTVEEKVALCHAQSKFSIKGVPRLGIPELWMSDGPHGVRAEINWDDWGYAGWTNDRCTAFPALTCLAATWNPEMSALYGKAVGEEARFRKKDVLLGPGVNICRTPMNGRNFEYMGEDPCLASKMVVPYVREAQTNGIAVCVKHYALNNQETRRMNVDVEVSDRALREIYLPAFRAATAEGGAWSIMGAYNKYRGQYCCHNEVLLQKILKQEWGYDGAVITDWSGCHSTEEAAANGLDIEMGTGSDGLTYSLENAYENYYLAQPYLAALREDRASTEELDDKARRVLRLIFRTVMSPERPWGSFATEEHAAAGRRVAQEGIVLLKNDGILPLRKETAGRILVVGDNAVRSMCRGGGSSELKPWREISPLEAVEEYYGKEHVVYAKGYEAGEPRYGHVVEPESDQEALRREAAEAARRADVVLFFGGLNKNHRQDCEDGDRDTYGLPFGQEELLAELHEANPNIVVTLISGNAVQTDWDRKARAVVQGWYLGSEAGHALVDVLSGEVCPSGKLPVSFYARLEDCPAHAFGPEAYPGVDDKVEYKEGVLVGYRWLGAKKIRAKYPFGYGLSYTTFRIGKPAADAKRYGAGDIVRVSVEVTNTGSVEGKEVVQLYAGKPKSAVERAPRELKAFVKETFAPGETRRVELAFPVAELAYWDEAEGAWEVEKGTYTVYVGNSSEATGAVKIEVQ